MSRISRLAADRRGIAAAEFAFVAPVLMLLVLGTTDMVTWMRAWLQVTRAASEVGQIIGQYTQLHESDFTGTFYPIAQNIAGSVTVQCIPGGAASGNVIISGVITANGKSTVSWQRLWGTAKGCNASQIGQQNTPATPATLPTGYIPPDGSAVVVVEVSTAQSAFVLSKASMFMNGSGPSLIRSYAVVTMRNGVLPSVQP